MADLTVGPATFQIDVATLAALRESLPDVAGQTVAAVVREVPGYAAAFTDRMAVTIEKAVFMALAGFLDLASLAERSDPSSPLRPALDAAYALGAGEARSGRTMIALLAAYRVGARVAWRGLADTAVAGGLPAVELAGFAELVFAYIDELSAASVSGHSDELTTAGRIRQRHLERLGQALLDDAPPAVLLAAAERAGWLPPRTLTAVLLPETPLAQAPTGLHPEVLRVEYEPASSSSGAAPLVLLVPEAGGRGRARLLRLLGQGAGTVGQAVVGPARPWLEVRASYLRALRAYRLGTLPGPVVDTDEHLGELVLGADPEALADLRARVLAPFNDLRPETARRLQLTLRSWLLHQGRRDDVAAELFVHPQTVRYRMGQLREVLGDRLHDPASVLDLTIALAGMDQAT